MGTNSKHLFGANMKIGCAPETAKFGTAAATVGADDLLPPSWTTSLNNVPIELDPGQIGIEGQRLGAVYPGYNVSGGLSGRLYFDSDPIWALIAAAIGEETVSGSDPYTHVFRFGENFYNSDNANGGTLCRYATVIIEAIAQGYGIGSFKPSSVEFTLDRDNGVMVNISGSGFRCVNSAVNPAAWTGRHTNADLVLLSNTCTFWMRMDEYSASQQLTSDDNIRPTSISISYDHGNNAEPDSGSGQGISEPTFTPTGRMVKLRWSQYYGNDDVGDYGRRNWMDAIPDETFLQSEIQISTAGDEQINWRFSKLQLNSPGILAIDGPDGQLVNYEATGVIPYESQTNDFSGLGLHPSDITLINDRAGTYLQALA